jgi:hypothetical protein
MVVKKTKANNISIELDLFCRARLNQCLLVSLGFGFSRTVFNETQILRQLHYFIILNIYTRKNLHLNLPGLRKIVFTPAEAIALMWMIRHERDINLVNLKSALHKTLFA